MKNEIEQLSLWDCFTRAFSDEISWDGRATRKEFWGHYFIACIMWAIVYLVCYYVLPKIAVSSSSNPVGTIVTFYSVMTLVVISLSIVYFYFYARLLVARLHDSGQSGLWLLLSVVPCGCFYLFWTIFDDFWHSELPFVLSVLCIIGSLVQLVFCALNSQHCTNSWGRCRLGGYDEESEEGEGKKNEHLTWEEGGAFIETHVGGKQYKMKIIGECGGVISLNPVKLEDKPLTIGRSRSCRLQLKDKKVSSRHCLIAGSDGKLVLCDLGSKNGTRLNGLSVKPNRNIVLHSGYVINIGDTKMEIHHA